MLPQPTLLTQQTFAVLLRFARSHQRCLDVPRRATNLGVESTLLVQQVPQPDSVQVHPSNGSFAEELVRARCSVHLTG